MNVDARSYNITIRHGEFEGETLFEARVKELPDLIEYGETYDEAYDLAIDAIETTAEALVKDGRPMPPPTVPVDDYSGRVTLRIPKSLHRALAEAADSECVSLNYHLVSILSYHTGVTTNVCHDIESIWWPADIVSAPTTGRREQAKLRVVESQDLKSAAGWD